MPYVIDRPVKRLLAVASACLPLLVFASPAAAYNSQYAQYQPSAPASSGCPMPSSSQVFSGLGDSSYYSLLPGGSFQGPLNGWVLNGASVVPGGEPWNVSNSANPQSLNLPAGSYAVTPTFCLTNLFPSWRFFADANNSSGSQLQVTALYSDINGYSGQITATTQSSDNYSSWAATPVLPLGSAVPAGDTVNVRLVFSVGSSGGTWNLDDLYIDPYSR